MKKHLLYLMLIFFVALADAGCKKDEVEIKKKLVDNKSVQTNVAGVNGPTTGIVNQTLNFTVMWNDTAQYNNFNRMEQASLGNVVSIKVFASGDSTSLLLSAKKVSSTPFKFKAAKAGVYFLKFYRADNSEKNAIIDTVKIK